MRVRTRGRVTAVPAELYVARVIAGEGEPNAPDAALQALAIAIRTFAAANTGRHRRDGFDLCDSTHCQVLRPSTPASREAALITAGRVLMYGGRPADVFYSASCGGRSEAVTDVWPGALDHPYLLSVEDDVHEGEAPWVVDLPVSRVETALRRAGFAGRRLKDLRIERRSVSGRVTRLHVSGMRPDTIAGDDFRLAVGARELRSTAFSVKKVGHAFRFTGRGYGHGVGMCVVGAGRRAARGETAAEILRRYYPGLMLTPVAAVSPAAAVERPSLPAADNTPSDGITVRVPPAINRVIVEQMALSARDELTKKLGVKAPARVTLEVYESVDAFRHATGRPWWTSAYVKGSVIELAPPAILAQRDGLEIVIRRAVTELLIGDTVANRAAWVKIGAARYFGSPRLGGAIKHVTCPSDAELNLAISAAAQRDAELRAEACFARAIADGIPWRSIR